MLAFRSVNVSRLVSVRVRRAGVRKVRNCSKSRDSHSPTDFGFWRSERGGVPLAVAGLLSSSRYQTIDGA